MLTTEQVNALSLTHDVKRREPEPCSAPAGSFEKIEVMRLRWENGEELYSDRDCKLILTEREGKAVSRLFDGRYCTDEEVVLDSSVA